MPRSIIGVVTWRGEIILIVLVLRISRSVLIAKGWPITVVKSPSLCRNAWRTSLRLHQWVRSLARMIIVTWTSWCRLLVGHAGSVVVAVQWVARLVTVILLVMRWLPVGSVSRLCVVWASKKYCSMLQLHTIPFLNSILSHK